MTATESPMEPVAEASGAVAPESVTVLADLRSHLRKSKAGISGIVICSLFALVAAVGPWLPFLPIPPSRACPTS